MTTENIVKFLETVYTDEKLAALLAHAQDGKLGYGSCCCLIGIPTADHALQEAPGLRILEARGINIWHYIDVKTSPDLKFCALALAAEEEFLYLDVDSNRRGVLIPLIQAEIARREALRITEQPIQESVAV